MFRPDAEPLLPNWRHLPVGYHGRAGSVVVAGTPIAGRAGQRREPGGDAASSGRASGSTSSSSSASSPACRARSASRSPSSEAREHVFGFVLVNDWSARDLQAGSTARSARSWASRSRPRSRPGSCRWRRSSRRVAAPGAGAGAAAVSAPRSLGARHRPRGRAQRREPSSRAPTRAGCTGPPPQQLAHATVNGAVVRPGDLFASGTISGPRAAAARLPARAVLERDASRSCWPTDRTRSFLEDGDRSSCAAPAATRVARRGPRADRAGGLMALPKAIRRLAPDRLRDDVRLRSIFVGAGLIPPRTMHSEHDAAVLRATAAGRRRVVELGVYEGSSAVVLCEVLDPGAELHLVDPFGHHGWALPGGVGGDRGRQPPRRGPGRAPSRRAASDLARRLQRRRRRAVAGRRRPRLHRRRPQRGGRPRRLGGLARLRGARRRGAVPRRAGVAGGRARAAGADGGGGLAVPRACGGGGVERRGARPTGRWRSSATRRRRCSALNSLIEGRECARARPLAVVLGANCPGLLPLSGSNPGAVRAPAPLRSRTRPDRRYSLSLDAAVNAAQRHRRSADDDPHIP